MRLPLFLLSFLLLLAIPASGDEVFFEVIRERRCTVSEMIDEFVAEFGSQIDTVPLRNEIRLAKRIGRPCRFVALRYRTTLPDGSPVEASGLLAFPDRGRFKGTVEVSPVSKDKSKCGSKQLFASEAFLPAFLGYVALIPDLLGFGLTEAWDNCYLMADQSVRMGVDFRLAANAWFKSEMGRELPARTVLMGYSLGANGALALAREYVSHPELGVKPKALFLGSGPYDPRLALESMLTSGRMDYMLYPGIVRSLNAYCDANLDPADLFQPSILVHWEEVSGGWEDPTVLAERYGTDLHAYLHPDFFREGYNPTIRRLFDVLETLTVLQPDDPLPAGLYVRLRHSAADNIVPVACTDRLYRQWHKPLDNVHYRRHRTDTHYDQGAQTYIDLMLYLLR